MAGALEQSDESDAEPSTDGRVPLRGVAVACGLLLAGLFALFGPVWLEGPTLVAPISTVYDKDPKVGLQYNDQRFVTSVIARNGQAFFGGARVFEAAHCFPTHNSLALGEPMLWHGLLGSPALLFGGDPILAYNLAILFSLLVAGLAMFVLVSAWTSSLAAALVAALLFAFSPARLHDIQHLYIYETTGLVLALYFAERMFARARLRDALGLSAAASIVFATSFYPVVSTLAFALPIAGWLALRYGVGLRLWKPLALVVVLTALGAAWVYLPYVSLEAAGDLPSRRGQAFFAGLWQLLPGGRYSPPVLLWCLAALAIPWRSSRVSVLRSDPRAAISLGLFLCVWLAMGPFATRQLWLPNLYWALADLLPGLDQVRVPLLVSTGLLPGLVILAGLGIGALLRALPADRHRRVVGTAFVALAFVATATPMAAYLGGAEAFRAHRMAPTEEQQALLRALAKDTSGPILELPLQPWNPADPERVRLGYLLEQTGQVFLAAYHRRETSGCTSSYQPPDRERLYRVERDLAGEGVLDALYDMGFRTIVVHHRGIAPAQLRALKGASRGRDAPLRRAFAHARSTGFVFANARDVSSR